MPDVAPLYVYGPLGVFMAFGLWFVISTFNKLAAEHEKTVARLIAERDDERAYTRHIEDSLRSQIIPLLTSTNQATTDAVRLITQQAALLEDRRRGEGHG